MKENKNNQKPQVGLVEKIKKTNPTTPEEPSGSTMSLQKFAVQTVREKFPETDFQNIEEINNVFIELHLDITDSLKMVEKILEKFIIHLNTNPMVGKLIKQLYSEENQQIQEGTFQNSNSYHREKTIKTIANFFEKNHLNNDKLNKFQTTLASIVRPISQNDIDDNILETILKVINIDTDIEDNYKKGVLDGRNQKIEEQIVQYGTNDGLYGNGAVSASSIKNSGYIERLLNSRK